MTFQFLSMKSNMNREEKLEDIRRDPFALAKYPELQDDIEAVLIAVKNFRSTIKICIYRVTC